MSEPGLERRELDGLPVWLSPRLLAAGVPHAFTTRLGGVSGGPFESLNMGLSTGDSITCVLENLRRAAGALGYMPAQLRFVRQVHGTRLVPAEAAVWQGGHPFEDAPEGDGLWSDRPGALVGVRVADCLPVLLATRDGRAVSAVHAGWRGVAGGILPEAVALLAKRAHAQPGDLVAAVGPGIGAARYEVGPDVAARFDDRFLTNGAGDRHHLDLAACAADQLRRAGVGGVDEARLCTYDHPDEFFSHRRDEGKTGTAGGVRGGAGGVTPGG